MLQSSQIPSTIAEGSSSYDSSDAVVENDESDEVSSYIGLVLLCIWYAAKKRR